MDLAGKKICVLGAAKSGVESALFLQREGAVVFVSELKDENQFADAAGKLSANKIGFEFGGHSEDKILNSDLIIISPGIPPYAPICEKIHQTQIPVWSEIELAYRYCPGKIVAVTGTNGKTTVTTLIQRVLEAGGLKAVSCGNIGNTFIGELGYIDGQTIVALEVSSFQLAHIHRFRPHIGVVLNLSANHYDWHGDFSAYRDAKWKLFSNQTERDFSLINLSDVEYVKRSKELKSQVIFFDGMQGSNPNYAVVEQVAHLLGVPAGISQSVLKNFSGIEHRLEHVMTYHGVRYVNDSKSTTIASLRWALSHVDTEIVLIAGGKFKGGDFRELRNLARQKVKFLIAIGEAQSLLHDAFQDMIPVYAAGSLEEALKVSRGASRHGQTVLFSPACASFDMFKNYEDRGQQFKQIVMSWRQEEASRPASDDFVASPGV